MGKLERLIESAINPMSEAQKAKDDMKYQQKKYPFVFHADKFFEGMTRDDATNLRNSLFINYQKAFDRIDSGDGVLSAKEIEYAAYEDQYNGKMGAATSFTLAGILATVPKLMKKDAIMNTLSKNKGFKAGIIGLTAYLTLAGVYSMVTAIKANKVAKQYS